jgi:zinc protease
LARSVALTESSFLSRLQHVGGFGGKSDQLNSYNMVLGEPGFFAGDLQRYRNASRQSVRQSAAAYLATADAVTLSVVPAGHFELAPPDSELVVVA